MGGGKNYPSLTFTFSPTISATDGSLSYTIMTTVFPINAPQESYPQDMDAHNTAPIDADPSDEIRSALQKLTVQDTPAPKRGPVSLGTCSVTFGASTAEPQSDQSNSATQEECFGYYKQPWRQQSTPPQSTPATQEQYFGYCNQPWPQQSITPQSTYAPQEQCFGYYNASLPQQSTPPQSTSATQERYVGYYKEPKPQQSTPRYEAPQPQYHALHNTLPLEDPLHLKGPFLHHDSSPLHGPRLSYLDPRLPDTFSYIQHGNPYVPDSGPAPYQSPAPPPRRLYGPHHPPILPQLTQIRGQLSLGPTSTTQAPILSSSPTDTPPDDSYDSYDLDSGPPPRSFSHLLDGPPKLHIHRGWHG